MRIEVFKKQVLPIKDQLFRFSLRIVGNVAIAEDVVQEVFIKLWAKREDLSEIKNLEAWCMRMTKNLSIDKLRSKHQKVGFFKEGFDVDNGMANPHQLTEQKDTITQIQLIMQRLPEKQRMTMHLRDIEGMTYEEITQVLHISLSQVKVNLFRARKFIRQELLNNKTYGL